MVCNFIFDCVTVKTENRLLLFLNYATFHGRGVLPMMAYTVRLPPERGTFFTLQVYKRVGTSVACSQTLYFLFEVRRARVIKYKSQGIY